jgi:hypothetical protein
MVVDPAAQSTAPWRQRSTSLRRFDWLLSLDRVSGNRQILVCRRNLAVLLLAALLRSMSMAAADHLPGFTLLACRLQTNLATESLSRFLMRVYRHRDGGFCPASDETEPAQNFQMTG